VDLCAFTHSQPSKRQKVSRKLHERNNRIRPSGKLQELLLLLLSVCSCIVSSIRIFRFTDMIMRYIISTPSIALLVLGGSIVRAFQPVTTPRAVSFTSLQATAGPRTLYDKIWDDHLVDDDGMSRLIYVDRHLVHEVTSPQAFEGLRLAGRGIRRPDCTLTTVDHNVPTSDRTSLVDVETFIEETASRTQVLQLEQNIRDFGLKYFSFADERQVRFCF
jgi:hypothetical protein